MLSDQRRFGIAVSLKSPYIWATVLFKGAIRLVRCDRARPDCLIQLLAKTSKEEGF